MRIENGQIVIEGPRILRMARHEHVKFTWRSELFCFIAECPECGRVHWGKTMPEAESRLKQYPCIERGVDMTTFMFEYPGDPPTVCELMTTAEFRGMFPDRRVRVFSGNIFGPPEELRLDSDSGPFTEIICDACGDEIGDTDTIWLIRRTQAWCKKCAAVYVEPYKVGHATTP